MPELPEVETIRRDLTKLAIGERIVDVWVDPATAPLLLDGSPEAFREEVCGRRILRIDRRGKYLLFRLDDGRTWATHLRMTGRLVWRRSDAPPEPYERAWVRFESGHDLRWCDLRKFGRWRLISCDDEVLGQLGPEPLDPSFSAEALASMLRGRRAPVKAVLLDQRRIAGLGNIYADEALFAAGIRPDTPAGSLEAAAVRRLHEAITDVIRRGIERRGASFRDYVDANGEEGAQQMYVQVFRRTGKPCYRCGTPISRIVVGGRSTHFCPHCQPQAGQAERVR
ncbi:Formamidopyrimidine-DNA glycosylase [bacterium HR29]|nr:Formamidopyrimidine-DNA glycosylase [bacterium HR29]